MLLVIVLAFVFGVRPESNFAMEEPSTVGVNAGRVSHWLVFFSSLVFPPSVLMVVAVAW